MSELEKKQNFLKTEIVDGGYDRFDFENFLMEQKDEKILDLNNWTMTELQAIVMKYQIKADQENGPVSKKGSIKKGNSIWDSENLFPEDKEEKNDQEEDKRTKIDKIVPIDDFSLPTNSYFTSKTFNKKKSFKDSEKEVKEEREEKVNKEEKKEKEKEQEQEEIEEEDPNSPFSITTEIICSKRQIPTLFTDNSDLLVKISNPEVIKKSFFSKSYIQYTITIKGMDEITQRRFSDFEWLHSKLTLIYPTLLVPPLPPYHMNLKDDSPKKVLYLNRFINALGQIRLIRSSELFKDFLTLPQVEFEAKKTAIYDKMQRPKSFSQFVTMDGIINIKISKANDKKAQDLNKDIYKKSNIYEKLTKALNNLMYQFDEIAKRYKELAKVFDELSNAYKDDGIIDKGYMRLSEIMTKWSKGYKDQKEFFQDEVKYYFKYIQKEIDGVISLYNNYKSSKDTYSVQYYGVKKLPTPNEKENNILLTLKRFYGMYLTSLLDEYRDLNKMHQERMIAQFILMSENRDTYTQDYNRFIELINMKE